MKIVRSLIVFLLVAIFCVPARPVTAETQSMPVLAVVPSDGSWTGTTHAGRSMSFTVQSNGAQWSTFALTTGFSSGGCTVTLTTNVPGPASITNGQFSWSGTHFAFTGSFTSALTASGTFTYTNQSTGCGTFSQSGTWTASVPPPPPAGFGKTSPSNGTTGQPLSLSLNWGSSAGADDYEYCYDTTNDNDCDILWVNNNASLSATISGLNPGTAYYWQVKAKNTSDTIYADGDESAWWSFTTLSLPGDFNKSSPADGAIDQPLNPILTWEASSGAASYQYCYDTTNDNTCTGWTSNGASTSKSLSGLSQNTTYYWHVRAVNAVGTVYSNGPETAFWSFTTGTLPEPFNKSDPVNGATNQPTNPTLAWEASAGADGYEYCYDTTNNNACSNWTDNGASTTVDLSGLSPNTTYYWHVRAMNPIGATYANGSSTAFWSFKIGAMPGAFSKTSPTNGALKQPNDPTLSWGASTGAAEYEYCFDQTNDNACDTPWITTNATSVPLGGLVNNTVYYWQVRAVSVIGTTNANMGAWWNFKVIISAPGLLLPVDGSHELTLRPIFDWEDVNETGVTGYTIQISKDNAFTQVIKTADTISSAYTPTADLQKGLTLFWRVQTKSANGPSDWSEVRSFTTPNPPPAPVPLQPTTNFLTIDYTPTFTWKPVVVTTGAIQNYVIQVDDSMDFTNPEVHDGSLVTPTFTPVDDLDPNTKYYWRVRAVNGDGELGDWSIVKYFRTALLPPTPVSPVNGFASPELRPLFDWNDDINANGYVIQISMTTDFKKPVLNGNVKTSDYVPTKDLPKDTTLYWRVQTKAAKNANGPSDWSEARSLTTPVDPPPAPVLLSPKNNALTTDYTPLFTWKPILMPLGTDFQNYIIQVDDDSLFGSPAVNDASITDQSILQFEPVSALAPNTKYYWRVRAVNMDNEMGNWSKVQYFRTAILPPTLLTPVDASTAGSLRPTFDWEDVTGANGYTIQISLSPTFATTFVKASTVVSTYTLLKDLPPGTTIYWRVQAKPAKGSNGPSNWSVTFSFVTP